MICGLLLPGSSEPPGCAFTLRVRSETRGVEYPILASAGAIVPFLRASSLPAP